MFKYPETHIIGTGQGLPAKCITNDDLVKQGMDTTDEWITSRSGIKQRYVCSEGEDTFTLALTAAQSAVEDAKINPQEIDLILVATCTPAQTFPAVAARLHGALGCKKECMVMDLNAACSGFVHAYITAQQFMATEVVKTALIVGAEAFSNLLDFEDRATAVLFGDGAGAVIVQKKEGIEGNKGDKKGTKRERKGLLAYQMFSDGEKEGHLYTSGGPGSTGEAGFIEMNGKEVFKHAVKGMSKVDETLLAEAGVSIQDIDWVVPHQANRRIIEASAKAMGVPLSKVVITVDMHANTSAATIPLALHTAIKDGRITKDNLVLFQAFGAGFVWSWALIQF